MNYYHKKFLSTLSAENVIAIFARYKGSPKEITESWGMLEAATKNFENIHNYTIIVVGDGCSPRTGAIFAYYTKAEVITIDPAFNMPHWEEHVRKQTGMGFPPQRISVIKEKVEDLKIDGKGRDCILIWPHSHAPMDKAFLFNFKSRSDIAMPCCQPIPKSFLEIPHISYVDYNIMSEKRTIHIWKDKKVINL